MSAEFEFSLYEGEDEEGRHVWNVYGLSDFGRAEISEKRSYEEHCAWAKEMNPRMERVIKEIEDITKCSVFRIQIEKNKGEAPR